MNWKQSLLVALAPTVIPLAAWATEPSMAQPADGDWLTVPAQSLEVQPGSPLDFSGLTGNGPAGGQGPLQIVGNRLAFSGGGASQRFGCAVLGSGPQRTQSFPTHDQADDLAAQLKLHGYTLARLHNTDYRLMPNAKGDLDINPDQLDRFYYLLASLKKNGVYWMTDILSVGARGLSGPHWNIPSSPDDLRVRLNFDPHARALWLKLVDTVYAARNPYTGKTVLQDPALAFVVGANENSIAFSAKGNQQFPTGFDTYFDQWVRQHYSTPAALAAALPDLTAAERSGAPIALPADWKGNDPRTRMVRQFAADAELDSYRWMTARLRERGFTGPLLAYHDLYPSMDNRTHAALPIIDIHAYNGEVASFAKGAKLQLPGSTTNAGLGNWLTDLSSRWLDKPMVASEYGQPFPNPYRYEDGLMFPAIAAFQGYSTICRTAFQPVEADIPPPNTRTPAIQGYSVGLDPTERAAETVAMLLFFRGDVRPATKTIAVPFGGQQFDTAGSGFMPSEVRRGALLARFGLVDPSRVRAYRGARVVQDLATPQTLSGKVADRLGNMAGGGPQARYASLVGGLRANATLPAGNRTDPAGGLYQSQTGQFTLDQRANTISVVTPRTEAVSAMNAANNLQLGNLTVRSLNAGAMVAASSLDGQPVASSHRLLLVMTGDARNTGMQMLGSGINWEMEDWGHFPIEMKRIVADLGLKTAAGRTGQLTVLSLRGQPLAHQPVSIGSDGVVNLKLDTGAVAGQPTTFFLLEIN